MCKRLRFAVLAPMNLCLLIIFSLAIVRSNAALASTPAGDNGAADNIMPPSVSALETVGTGPTDVSTLSNWPLVLLTLVLIVVMILVLGWLAKRFSGLGAMGGQTMKVISAIPVGTRERIALVDVQGKQILVGITQHNINLLHAFDEPVMETSAPPSSEFSQKLGALLNAAKDSKS